jgi:hypothetical protein
VGTNLHFSAHVISIATELLRKSFSVPPEVEEIPPFIAVHIRRNDFKGWCGGLSPEICLAPLSAYTRRVEEVKAALLKSHPKLQGKVNGKEIKVLVMTDEPHHTVAWSQLPPGTSEAWWAETYELGWSSIRHDIEKTAEKYGLW